MGLIIRPTSDNDGKLDLFEMHDRYNNNDDVGARIRDNCSPV